MTNFWLLGLTQEEFDEMPYDRAHIILVEANDEDEARQVATKEHDEFCDPLYKGIWLDNNRTIAQKLEITGSPKFIAEYGWPS